MGGRRQGFDRARLEALCARWPGVTRDIKWETRRVYSVDGKMFAMTAEDPGEPFQLYVKVPDERFLELTDRPGIVPAPYLARARWVMVAEPARLGAAELAALVLDSYALVRAKLAKRRQAELGPLPVPEAVR
ncbi:MmcQ/YjbR family DNA-binding protein [Fulvimonas sp. R45]|uniref:MmcQ/YjbR family DNA-binding protein n=1 Tax=Fulvimonas sp. R45 TaxID=3045937 RepID=UPI00266002D2|nr:MmcQ/YjbR family DNA-binding protein [Fulvimonas sp. R45]MDO1530042.1 MmcQ/YjbR family DNA-binding protein [Fulvimonas sp. R45]